LGSRYYSCHGWLSSLLPLYLRNYYGNEPLFSGAKIVTSVYNQSFDESLDTSMHKKILFDGLDNDNVKHLKKPTYVNLMKTAIDNSDAVIIGGDDIPAELSKYLKKLEKPVLDYKTPEEFSTAYQDFYNTQVLSQ